MGNPFFDDVAGPAAALSKPDGLDWFDRQTPERQKALSTFMIARMMCGTTDPVHLVRMNAVVNPYQFGDASTGRLAPDKAAFMKLLHVAANHGRRVSYSWLKGPSGSSSTVSSRVIREYYECSERESAQYSIDAESLIEMAEELGYDADELAKLKKEVQSGSRDAEKPSKKPAKRR